MQHGASWTHPLSHGAPSSWLHSASGLLQVAESEGTAWQTDYSSVSGSGKSEAHSFYSPASYYLLLLGIRLDSREIGVVSSTRMRRTMSRTSSAKRMVTTTQRFQSRTLQRTPPTESKLPISLSNFFNMLPPSPSLFPRVAEEECVHPEYLPDRSQRGTTLWDRREDSRQECVDCVGDHREDVV